MTTSTGNLVSRAPFRFLSIAVIAALALALPAPAFAQLNNGDVLAGVGAGKIKRFTPAGVLQSTLDSTTNSSETTGMCFDALGNLYATMFSISSMSKFSNTGALLAANFGTGYNADPESCVVDAAQNLLLSCGLLRLRGLLPR